MTALSSKPIIAILGSTGVGKSKLAVDLALALSRKLVDAWDGAEVINADSMQVYSGLDIITNKVSEHEKRGVKHHLIGFKNVHEQYFVHEWIQDTVPIIDRLHQSNRVPLVVGGTAYWMQHLLFPDRLGPLNEESDAPRPTTSFKCALESLSIDQRHMFDTLANVVPESTTPAFALQLHGLLTTLDPITAARWHWKDTRKVLRSLELMQEHQSLASEIFAAQSERQIAPRYRTLILWLNAPAESLRPRLDRRIQDMIDLGLLNEIQTMREIADQMQGPIDYTHGIFQSIGYKEFSDYLDDPARPKTLLESSMETMRISTWKYAQRQIKWIIHKLMPVVSTVGSAASMVILDTSNLDMWDTHVYRPATAAVQAFLRGEAVGAEYTSSSMGHYYESIRKANTPLEALAAMRKTTCSLCTADPSEPFMVDEAQWKIHVSSRVHKRAVKRKQNAERFEAYLASLKQPDDLAASSESEGSLKPDR